MAIEAGDVVGRLRIETADAVANLQQFSSRGQQSLNNLANIAKTAGKDFEGIGRNPGLRTAAEQLGNALKNSFFGGSEALKGIEPAANRATTALDGIRKASTGIGAALGAALGAAGIVGYIGHIINLGDKLSDLADQTGLTVEVLGGIRPIAEKSGSSIEQFARGVSLAQKNLGNVTDESKGVAEGLKAIGLSVNELIQLSPDEFIERLAKGLGSIENPSSRAALASKVLGRSFMELGPTILSIAEHGLPRLSQETADSYRHLGELKDQVDGLRVKLEDLAATGITAIAKLFGIMSAPPLEELGKVADRVEFLSGRLARIRGIPQGQIDAQTTDQLRAMEKSIPDRGMVGEFISPSGKKTLQDLIAARQEQEKLFETINKTKAATAGNPLGLGKSEDIKKVQNDIDKFLDSLQKALSAITVKNIELKFGADAGLKAQLDAQFDTFVEGLKAKQLPVPKGLQDFFVLLRDKIIDANKELQRTTFEMKRVDELEKALSQDSAEWLNAAQDWAKIANDALAKVETQFKDLQKTLAIEILPTDQQGAARTTAEFEDRVKVINDWREAAIRAGTDVEEASQKAAQATTDAWVASQQKLKDQADESSEFVKRAFERGFDVVSDAFKDLADNGFKNFGDFAEKIRKTLNGLAADFLTLTLKESVLGPDFGKKGAPIGGLLGDLLGIKKPESKQIPGITGADTLDAEFGQQLRDAAGAFSPATAQLSLSTTEFSLATTEFAAAVQQFAAASSVTSAGGNAGGLLGLFSGGESILGTADPYAALSEGLIGGFAKGGEMQAGKIAWVGEKGPELFIPKVSGEIVPLEKLSRMGAMNGGFRQWTLPQIDYSSVFPGRAEGGSVNANATYAVGEKGVPEMFLPDVRGRLDPKILQAVQGGNHTINVNINSPDVDGFRRSQATILAHIGEVVERSKKYR